VNELVIVWFRDNILSSGKQPGDPARAAEAMIGMTEVENPPRHLVLGAFGIDAVMAKLKASLAEIEQWRDTGLATDFPQAATEEPA
jgi:hypothetical protein